MSLIRNSGRHQHHCRSRTRWPEFLIRLMIMRLCEPDGWDDRDGLVGSAGAFVV